MAYTQTDLDNIKRAIATGVMRVKVGERDTTFRSLAEMERTQRLIEDDLASQLAPRTKIYRFSTDKGVR